MTRDALFLLGIALGVLLGAACVVIGFNLGSATAAASRPVPVVLVPLPRAAGSTVTVARGPRIPSEATGTGQDDPVRRPLAYGEPPVVPAVSDMDVQASVEGLPSARLAVRGIASWYDNGPGAYGAAGPALRVGDWRGRMVDVCVTGHAQCIRLQLVDWCACGDRPGGPTVIDLSKEAFAALGISPSRGLVEVTVTG